MNGWIMAAICVHNFALEHENFQDIEKDSFFFEECSYQAARGQQSHYDAAAAIESSHSRQILLAQGRRKREELKRALLNE
jgi:hypothetical protein